MTIDRRTWLGASLAAVSSFLWPPTHTPAKAASSVVPEAPTPPRPRFWVRAITEGEPMPLVPFTGRRAVWEDLAQDRAGKGYNVKAWEILEEVEPDKLVLVCSECLADIHSFRMFPGDTFTIDFGQERSMGLRNDWGSWGERY